jgi:hypothetical protein
LEGSAALRQHAAGKGARHEHNVVGYAARRARRRMPSSGSMWRMRGSGSRLRTAWRRASCRGIAATQRAALRQRGRDGSRTLAQAASATAAVAGSRTGKVVSGNRGGACTRACGSGGFAVDELRRRGRGGIGE